MPAPRRWIRLDVGWDDSEWLDNIHPIAQLAWVKFLCYVKRDGIRGSVKRLSTTKIAEKCKLPTSAVTEMLEAAKADEAVIEADGTWTIANWPTYQGDPTHAERQKRYRDTRE